MLNKNIRFVGLDPAISTGLVILDLEGKVITAKRIKTDKKVVGAIKIKHLVEMQSKLMCELKLGDIVVAESTAFGTIKAVTTGMIHGVIKTAAMVASGNSITNINPSHTKLYVSCTKKVANHLKKKVIAEAVKEMYGFEHESHDVIDAFILANVCRDLYLLSHGLKSNFTDDQLKVLKHVMVKGVDLDDEPKKPATKKPSKRTKKTD